VAAHLGVVLQDTQPPASETFGPIVSADVGVVIETAPPAAEPDTAFATQLGVAVGPFVTGVQAPPLTPNSTGTLTISGVALGSDVTAVQIVPPTGAAVGALTIAPDGTQITTPLTLIVPAMLTLPLARITTGVLMVLRANVTVTLAGMVTVVKLKMPDGGSGTVVLTVGLNSPSAPVLPLL